MLNISLLQVVVAADLAPLALITAVAAERVAIELLLDFLLPEALHIPLQWEPEALQIPMAATAFLVLLRLLEGVREAD
jgi:hypothetical protein